MEFNEYQEKASSLAIYPLTTVVENGKAVGASYIYPVMGLCGEAGELANKVKKLIRDKKGKIRDENGELLSEIKEEITGEIGGILWYIQQVCTEFDLELNDVAQYNIKQLDSRKERGVLQGSGDNR